jgi:hypothetical protein
VFLDDFGDVRPLHLLHIHAPDLNAMAVREPYAI